MCCRLRGDMRGASGERNLKVPSRTDQALARLAGWMFDGLPLHQTVEDEAFQQWLSADFGNVATAESYHVNENGSVLLEFVGNLSMSESNKDATVPRGATRSLLLVSQYAPSLSHAGGLRVLDLYREIRAIQPDIRIDLYCGRNPAIDGDLSCLDGVFDEIHMVDPERFDFSEFQRSPLSKTSYDLVDLQFHAAGRLARKFQKVSRRTLFTPMECVSRSYYDLIRDKLKTSRSISKSDIFGFIHSAIDEVRIGSIVDATICVSDADASLLDKIIRNRPVDFMPTGLSKYEFEDQLSPAFRPRPCSERARRLVFAAYFGSYTNIEGLKWYVDHVHPIVAKAVPDYELAVVGRGDARNAVPDDVPGVVIIGEVPKLSPVFDQARAGLVLALHGSGFRGKINQYAICGLPAVSTPLGITGLSYTPGLDIISADGAVNFAEECIRILTDDEHADRIAAAAHKCASDNYSWQTNHNRIQNFYGLK